MATQFAVDLVFKSQTQQLDQVVSKIQKFERDLGKLKGQNPFEGAERGARGAAGGIDRVGNSAKKAEGAIGGLRNALLTLGLGALVKTAFGAAAEIERTKKQLETLTGTAETAGRIYAELQRVNKQSPFELKDLTGAAAKLSAFGVETKDLVATTERLGKIAAGTGSEIGGIALAYGQVLAKGRLQGEELMQFQERGIGLGKELQKMLGVTGEEFADMTAKGKISSELVVQAVKNMTGETGKFKDAFVNTSETLDAKLSNLKDAFFNAAGALGKAFEPIFKWMINQLTYILNLVTDAINRWQGVQSLTPEKMDSIRKQADQEAGQRFPGFNPFSNAKGDFYNRRINELTDQAIKAATKGVAAGAVAQSTAAPSPGTYTADQVARNRALLAGGDTKPGGSRSSAATRLAGPKLPEYIDKEVLRKWLMSQGMGRTSGDFTNSGHKTPNHMLNAMDMGFTSSKYDHNYVQKTIEMERKLRATGAFGNQLFGPERDPKGHKDHLHVPTPGGKVKMNPALASLMGIAGGGQEGQVELAQNLIELEAERAEKIRESFIAGQQLATEFERELKIRSASTELEKNLLKFKFEAQDRQAEINELMDAGQVQSLTLLNQEQERLQVLEAQVRAFYDQADAAGALSVQMKSKGSGAFRTDIDLDPNKKTGKIQSYMDQLEIDLADTEGVITSLAGTIESEIGSAMSNAITGLIQGTTTAQEAFGQMFANIGKAFIDMATQMIAKALILKVLGILGGGLSGGGIGANNYSGAFGGGSSVGFNPASFGGGFSFAGGGYTGNGARSGGVDGQGGFPAILHPQETVIDHTQNALAQSRGALGGGGVTSDAAFSENRDALNTISSTSRERQVERWITSGAGSTEIKYSRVGAGDLPFVTEQDMLQATRVAAQEGARMGQQRTMAALKNNPGARRTIGI